MSRVLRSATLIGLLACGSTALAAQPLKLLKADASVITFRYEAATPRFDSQASGRVSVTLDGWGRLNGPGAPDLPFARALVAVPVGTRPSISWSDEPSEIFEGLVPVAARAFSDPLDIAGEGKADSEPETEGPAYRDTKPYPAAPAWIEWVGSLGGVAVASIGVAPCAYLPGKGILAYPSLELTVRFVPDPAAGVSSAEASRLAPNVLSLARELVANPDQLPQPGPAPMQPRSLPVPSIADTGVRVKIFVDSDGLYAVTHDDLVAAGADPGTIGTATFRLEENGQEVAILMQDGGNGTFDTGDRFLFFGRGMTGPYTRRNVYWLSWGGSAGLRMAQRDATPSSALPVVTTFPATVRREINAAYWQNAPGDIDFDRWYEKKTYVGQSNDYTFTLANHDTSAATARLRVMLMGRTDTAANPDHDTRILLNGAQVDEQFWNGQIPFLHDVTVSRSLLLEGTNTVTVVQPGGADPNLDTIYFNWLQVDYSDGLVAVSNFLRFTLDNSTTGDVEAHVDGFSTSDVSVYDITDPTRPVTLAGVAVSAVAGGYRARFDQRGAAVDGYLALTDASVQHPAGFLKDARSDLKNPANGADYLIVTHASFLSSARRLAQHRAATDGMRVMVVDVQDVYDDFSGGVYSPPAISNFVAYALTSWQPPAPGYLLLVGDANQDYLDNFTTGSPDFLPTRLIMTPSVGETPSDNLYAAVLGTDPLPDIVVGRMAARTTADADAMVDKTIAYESLPPGSPLTTQELFVADSGSQAFEDVLEGLIAHRLPATHTPRRVYLANYATTAAARADIIGRVNSGVLLTTYMGHGAVNYWSASVLFQVSDVASLANGPLETFAVMLDCINGYYPHSFIPYSLAEEWFRWPDRGAIFAWAPTGYGYEADYRSLSDRLYEEIFSQGQDRAGLAAHRGKISAVVNDFAQTEELYSMTFFGDPAAHLALDRDGDGHLDRNDCAPSDATVWGSPSEVGGAVFFADKATLSWNSLATQAGPGTVYDVLRGSIRELPVGSGASEICLGDNSAALSWSDGAVPIAGGAFFYLVRGENVCGIGAYGTQSTGVVRTSPACP